MSDRGTQKALNRRQRRELKRASQGKGNQQHNDNTPSYNTSLANFRLADIKPKTINQDKTIRSYYEGQNLLLSGAAGCGKTFLALFLAMTDILEQAEYDKVIIIRSCVPSRAIGFLPGKEEEKNEVYEKPYQPIFADLFGRDDAYSVLKKKGIVEFENTSFLRGTTFKNSIIVMDEIENFAPNEMHASITRVGDNCRVIACGDVKQTDFRFEDERLGMINFMKCVERMKSFDHIIFNKNDCVRSGIAREYLFACDELGI